jgi:hypothetical protein
MKWKIRYLEWKSVGSANNKYLFPFISGLSQKEFEKMRPMRMSG